MSFHRAKYFHKAANYYCKMKETPLSSPNKELFSLEGNCYTLRNKVQHYRE
ncbi:hypothetical protein BHOIPH791_07440 [Bartonella henselae]|nr:hypothetical protein BH623125_06530 [Bartonella henselae]